MCTLEINVVFFGGKPSFYLITCAVKQLAKDKANRLSRASKILTPDLYDYDLLIGANTLDNKVRDEIIDLLKCGRFFIHQ